MSIDGGGDGLSAGVFDVAQRRIRELIASELPLARRVLLVHHPDLRLQGGPPRGQDHRARGERRARSTRELRRSSLRDGRSRMWAACSSIRALRALGALPRDFDSADLAASIQALPRTWRTRFVRYWVGRRRTGDASRSPAGSSPTCAINQEHSRARPRSTASSSIPACPTGACGVARRWRHITLRPARPHRAAPRDCRTSTSAPTTTRPRSSARSAPRACPCGASTRSSPRSRGCSPTAGGGALQRPHGVRPARARQPLDPLPRHRPGRERLAEQAPRAHRVHAVRAGHAQDEARDACFHGLAGARARRASS